MIRATKKDKELIIKILAQAFDSNQSVNYIIRQDGKRQERIKALMDYSFDICALFGDIWLSEDKTGCALVLYPQLKRTSLKALLLDLRLIWHTIGLKNLKKAIDRESKIKAKQSREPMTYLWFIGVAPQHQHQGTGSRLMLDLISDLRDKQLPIFLETSTLQNLPWYERHGFKIYDQLKLTYPLFFLKHP